MKIEKVAVIGMGAVGTVYGKLLYKSFGDSFYVITSKTRKEKSIKQGFALNDYTFYPKIVAPGDKKIKFDLIIFCVKNYQLDEALKDVSEFVGEKTILLTLLNGVTSRSRIHAAFPENKALYGLSIKIDAQRNQEGKIVNNVDGEIHFGEADNTALSEEVKAVQECFNKANIENYVFPDMIRMIWKKFMLNVGVNQVSAVTRAKFGKITSVPTNLKLFKQAMTEVLAIAKASNIDLREEDIEEYVELMSGFSPQGRTSMLQDIESKRKTEVDYFAGTVVEMGKKLNIPTPVNQVLYCIIKSLEELY